MKTSTDHLLTFQEQQWVKDRTYNVLSVKVRRLCAEIVKLENELSEKRDELDVLSAQIQEKLGGQ